MESDCKYAAVGSGEEYALGSLYTTSSQAVFDWAKHYTPGERLVVALEAAEKFCGSVQAPFHIVTTERLKK